MKIFKPFLAGMILPALMLPFMTIILYVLKGEYSHFFLIAPFVPLILGIWNILFINFETISPIIDRNINIWLWGSLLGLILISTATIFSIPKEIYKIEGFMSYGIFFMAPVVYGVVWRYFVKFFNESLDLF